jgi:hypothetical protein
MLNTIVLCWGWWWWWEKAWMGIDRTTQQDASQFAHLTSHHKTSCWVWLRIVLWVKFTVMERNLNLNPPHLLTSCWGGTEKKLLLLFIFRQVSLSKIKPGSLHMYAVMVHGGVPRRWHWQWFFIINVKIVNSNLIMRSKWLTLDTANHAILLVNEVTGKPIVIGDKPIIVLLIRNRQ